MEKISGIYCILNKINQKKYIGLSQDIYRRWGEHKRWAFNDQRKEYSLPLYNSIRKYGLENFEFSIIEKCEPFLLKEREKYWIKYYNTIEDGYNLTEGGEYSSLKEEQHPNSKLTKQDVIFCRKEYAKGSRSKDIYNKYYYNILTYQGFQAMWHGKTWRDIMPEVFENKINSRQKITEEDILNIRFLYYKGIPMKDIKEEYKNKYSPSTVARVINEKNFYPEIQPNIEDNHVNLRYKITEEDVRLIKDLKQKGFLHKEIKKALNDKVSMTTISDIVNGKRYSDIK